MDLSIIIVNWRSMHYLRSCLASIYQNTAGISFEIIVIDNASYDGCGEMLAREYPQVSFIQSEQNLGFAKANNLCAQKRSGDHLLFLNPDTEVTGSALQELLAVARRMERVGVVGPMLLNSDGSVQTSCILSLPTILNQVLDSDFLRHCFPRSFLWGTTPLSSNSKDPSVVEAISGACFMIKREVCERVGGFDERYFMYAEDIDLSYKVHEAGYKLYYVPSATVVHHGGGSSNGARNAFSAVMMRESVCRFLRLRRGRASATMYRFFLGVSSLLRLALIALMDLARGRWPSTESASINKWFAILRWSLGLERWARMREPHGARPGLDADIALT